MVACGITIVAEIDRNAAALGFDPEALARQMASGRLIAALDNAMTAGTCGTGRRT